LISPLATLFPGNFQSLFLPLNPGEDKNPKMATFICSIRATLVEEFSNRDKACPMVFHAGQHGVPLSVAKPAD
jgi:hypothetical protein